MTRSSRHPREVRERAVALVLVLEGQPEYGSQWEAWSQVVGATLTLSSSSSSFSAGLEP